MKKSQPQIEHSVKEPTGSSLPILVPLALLPILLAAGSLLAERTAFGISQWGILSDWLWGSAAIGYYIVLFLSWRLRPGSESGKRSVGRNRRATKPLMWTLAAIALGVLFFVCRSRSYFYGDGYMVIDGSTHALFSGISGDEAVKVFTILICRFAVTALGFIFPGMPQIPIAIVNSIGGVVAVAALVRISLILGKNRSEQVFIFLASLTSACVVLCFGWVEHYTWTLAALLWGLYFSVSYFQSGTGYWRAILAWCVTAGFSLALGPMLLLFLFVADLFKRKKLPSVGRLCLTVGLVGLLMAVLCFFLVPTLTIVPFIPSSSKPYWALSPDHLLDLLNLALLVSPLGVLFLIFGFQRRRVKLVTPDDAFLGAGALMLFMIFFWIDPELGAPRDWDLLSLFGIPLSLYGARTIVHQVDSRRVRSAVWPTACLVVMVIAPNVYEKSHPNIALARLDRWLWEDPHYQVTYQGAARGITWAALLQTSAGHPELADKYLWRRLSVVPDEDITWFNLGEIELVRQQFDSASVAFEKAYRVWPEHDVYLVRYAQALQATKSSTLRELIPRLIHMKSDNSKVLENAALVLANEGLVNEALTLFREEVKLEPMNSRPLVYLALSFHRLNQPDSAISYFQRALPIVPKADRQRIYATLIADQYVAGRLNDARSTLLEFRRQFPGDTLLSSFQNLLDARH